MEEPDEGVLRTIKGKEWRLGERSELEREIWDPPGEEVLVEAVGLNKLARGEVVEMETKTAKGRSEGNFCSRKNLRIQRKNKETAGDLRECKAP